MNKARCDCQQPEYVTSTYSQKIIGNQQNRHSEELPTKV